MNIGDIFECEILSQGINGEGVARIDNFVVFVPFALPNEKVIIEIVNICFLFSGFASIVNLKSPSETPITAIGIIRFAVCIKISATPNSALDRYAV